MTGDMMIDERQLARLIDVFYAHIRADEQLGPIFNGAIADWPDHLDKLTAFWSSVMMASGKYKGNPMAAHMMHKDQIKPEHFDRWLALWDRTTTELMPPAAAQALQDKAARIAESLKLALWFRIPRPASTEKAA